MFASGDRHFDNAVFGRDSIEVAEDLLGKDPDLVETVILTLARLQGTDDRAVSEEEPGKIHHEFRPGEVAGKPIPRHSAAILDSLLERWSDQAGRARKELTYYGSVDATPGYLRLIGRFCDEHGNAILSRVVESRAGERTTVRETVDRAAEWLTRNLEASRSGLLEYRRRNPRSLKHFYWKDSGTGLLHEDGAEPAIERPVGATAVQGLAVDALDSAAQLVGKSDSAQAERWKRLGAHVARKTLSLLWLPERGYFASGFDRCSDGRLRLVTTESSDQGLLLDSAIFQYESPSEYQGHVSAILRRLCSSEFMTDYGVRSRALRHATLTDHADYHGSFAVWPKETHDLARGMRRQGFSRLADELERRNIRAVNESGANQELLYVDERGHLVDYRSLPGARRPERLQAWTVSAILEAKRRRGSRGLPIFSGADGWKRALETELLESI